MLHHCYMNNHSVRWTHISNKVQCRINATKFVSALLQLLYVFTHSYTFTQTHIYIDTKLPKVH